MTETSPPGIVLDASAILADLYDEPGALAVRSALPRAIVSAANFAEVITKLIDRGLIEQAKAFSENAPCHVAPIDEADAAQAGLMHANTRGHGISLGDRFCLVLAQRLGALALTTDRAWKALDIGVEVVLIR